MGPQAAVSLSERADALEHQMIDNGKLRLGWEPSDAFHATYIAGFFGNRDRADVQSYLSASAPVNDLYVSWFRPVPPIGAHERLLFPGLVLPALVLLGALARVRVAAADWTRRSRRVFGA